VRNEPAIVQESVQGVGRDLNAVVWGEHSERTRGHQGIYETGLGDKWSRGDVGDLEDEVGYRVPETPLPGPFPLPSFWTTSLSSLLIPVSCLVPFG
jgi:hypothetical protein